LVEGLESRVEGQKCQLVFWPSTLNPQLSTKLSLPGVEPGLRPSQSRVRPPHSKDENG
jgi:hypothetical protein